MNDNQPLTAEELEDIGQSLSGAGSMAFHEGPRRYCVETARRLLREVYRLRARDADLATARTFTRRLLDFWHVDSDGDEPVWLLECGVDDDRIDVEPMSDAERTWLASVSPPTSGDDG